MSEDERKRRHGASGSENPEILLTSSMKAPFPFFRQLTTKVRPRPIPKRRQLPQSKARTRATHGQRTHARAVLRNMRMRVAGWGNLIQRRGILSKVTFDCLSSVHTTHDTDEAVYSDTGYRDTV